MTLIEVISHTETTSPIEVHHQPIDYAAEAARYHQEANGFPVGSMERNAKIDTAKYLAKRAFDNRIQEYLGNTESIHSR